MSKPILNHFAATIPVADLQSTIKWYQEKLSFSIEFEWEDPATYVIMKRDNLVVHFSQVNKDYRIPKPHPSLYVFVKYDINELYQEFKSKGVKLGELVKTNYEMTDFDLYDLNGFRITFGQGQT